MSRLLRSPTNSDLQRTVSDSDVVNTPSQNTPPNFVSQRKRPRQSSEERFCSFKDEIKVMLSEWKETQNTLLNKLVAEVAEIKQQNAEIKHTNEEIEKSLQFINEKYEDMKKKVEDLEGERKEHLLKIASLESEIGEVQRNLKSATIELRNVPKTTDTETKTDLCNIIEKTCQVIDVNIQATNIRDVFRVTSKAGKSTIVAELTTVIMKNHIIQGAKAFNEKHPDQRLNSGHIGFKGVITPIYISEALTSKGRRLFFLARDLAKSKEYKFCWTNSGKIFIRKAIDAPRIEIKDELQIATLRNAL